MIDKNANIIDSGRSLLRKYNPDIELDDFDYFTIGICIVKFEKEDWFENWIQDYANSDELKRGHLLLFAQCKDYLK